MTEAWSWADVEGLSNIKTAPLPTTNGGADDDKIIGANLARIRVECGVTQAELAEMEGISIGAYQHYEYGKNHISASRLHRIARRLGVPVEAFFEGCG